MSYQTLTNLGVDGSLCVDSSGNIAQNGSKLNMNTCNGQPNQNWLINRSNNTLQSNLGDRSYCLDLPGGNTANGTQLQIWNCNGNPNQNWKLTGNTFVHQNSGKCMDVNAGNNTVEIWDCNNKSTNQSFIGHNSNPIVDCTQGDNIISNSFCSNDLKQNDPLLYSSLLSTYCYDNGSFKNTHDECVAIIGKPFILGVPTPLPSVCSDTSGNLQLTSACACIKDSNVALSTGDQYKKQLEESNISKAVRNTQDAALKAWDSKRTAQLNSIRTQTRRGTCASAGACNNSSCDSGWVSDGSITGNHDNCEICFIGICATTGCAVNCVQNEATVQDALKPWLSINPPPPPLIDTLVSPSSNTINIQCCSQILSGITAKDFSADLQQNCTQKITTDINSALNQTTTTPTSNSTDPTTTSNPTTTTTSNPTTTISKPTTTISSSKTNNNNLIIAGIIIVLVIIFFIFFFGITAILIF